MSTDIIEPELKIFFLSASRRGITAANLALEAINNRRAEIGENQIPLFDLEESLLGAQAWLTNDRMAVALEALRFDTLDDLFVIPDLPEDLEVEDYEIAFDAGARTINDENLSDDFFPPKDESRIGEPVDGYTAIDGHTPRPSEFLAQWSKSVFSGSNIPDRSGFSIVAAADPDPIPAEIEKARPISTNEEIIALWETNRNINTTHEDVLNGYLALKELHASRAAVNVATFWHGAVLANGLDLSKGNAFSDRVYVMQVDADIHLDSFPSAEVDNGGEVIIGGMHVSDTLDVRLAVS